MFVNALFVITKITNECDAKKRTSNLWMPFMITYICSFIGKRKKKTFCVYKIRHSHDELLYQLISRNEQKRNRLILRWEKTYSTRLFHTVFFCIFDLDFTLGNFEGSTRNLETRYSSLLIVNTLEWLKTLSVFVLYSSIPTM